MFLGDLDADLSRLMAFLLLRAGPCFSDHNRAKAEIGSFRNPPLPIRFSRSRKGNESRQALSFVLAKDKFSKSPSWRRSPRHQSPSALKAGCVRPRR